MATGKRIEFMSLDETVTETAEEIVPEITAEENPHVEQDSDLPPDDEPPEEVKVAMDKIENGESLNPNDRKSLRGLEWLIDKRKK